MEDFSTLVFLLFVLWPLLARLLKGGQGTQAPGRPRQGHRPAQGPGRPAGPPAGERPARREPVSAADMIPDDLWEILTGERRRPAPVSAPPAPVEARKVEDAALPEVREDEPEPVPVEGEDAWEPVRPRPLPPRPAPRPEVSLEAEPVIVSLEESVQSVEARHAAFHARIGAAPRPRPRRRRALRLNLGDMDEVRRMVVLGEVLGPPKALE